LLSTGRFPDIKHLNGTDGRRFEYKAFNAFEQTLEEHGEIIDNAERRDNDVGIGQDPVFVRDKTSGESLADAQRRVGDNEGTTGTGRLREKRRGLANAEKDSKGISETPDVNGEAPQKGASSVMNRENGGVEGNGVSALPQKSE
jgi:hypothetical protein